MLVVAAMDKVAKNLSSTVNKQMLCCPFFFFFHRKRSGIKQRRVLPAPRSRTLCLLSAQRQLKLQNYLIHVLLHKKSTRRAVKQPKRVLLYLLVAVEGTGRWVPWQRKLAAQKRLQRAVTAARM